MWINCVIENGIPDIEIKYYIDDEHFYVISSAENAEVDSESELFALFYNKGGFNQFPIGKYSGNMGKMAVDKQYSISYIKSNGIIPEHFSYFKLVTSYGKSVKAYPLNNMSNINSDRAIINAREVLNSLKQSTGVNDIDNVINYIRQRLKLYETETLTFMMNYTWYKINSCTETFGLSSVKHLICSNDFYNNMEEWYFGVNKEERIYAVAVRCNNCINNPLGNADDCTIVYSGESINCYYFVVGIILLDDGQYFCRLD